MTAHAATLAMLAAAALPGASFPKTRLIAGEGAKRKLVQAPLECSDSGIRLSPKGEAGLEVPYPAISKISYERVERRRVNEGAMAGGVVVMLTKTQSHWWAIDYTGSAGAKQVIVQLHKDEIEAAITGCEAKWGKPIERLSKDEHRIAPAAGSRDMDEKVGYAPEQLVPALKRAFDKYSCAITKEKPGQIECKRPKTANSEITGIGGETVIAKLDRKGTSTRVRIRTDRGFSGSFAKKNWSTPIYQAMMDALKAARS